ncbi:MAG: hypothetical protein JNG85_14690 [Spirochaetaceae bacterium]|nr:hypothetical protein [Spirochaetaceae bacterium]
MAINEMRDRRAADWLKCRDEREDKKFHWTTGEIATYRGFFELGFEAGIAYREEIEARASEQGGEMREALTELVGSLSLFVGVRSSDPASRPLTAFQQAGWAAIDRARALLVRESAEPAEELDYTVCEDACRGTCPACTKPAEERGPEVGR